MEDDKWKAYALLGAFTAYAFLAYFVNNAYENWTVNANPVLVLAVYYGPSEPVYLAFIILFAYTVYQEEESTESAIRGIAASIFALVGLDLMSIPYAVSSITSLSGTLVLLNNPLLSPFGDYQLINAIAGASHVVNFLNDFGVHVLIPVVLLFFALLLAKPHWFIEIVERS